MTQDEKKEPKENIESACDLANSQAARRSAAEETAREKLAVARKKADELISLAQQAALKLVMDASQRATGLIDVAYTEAELLLEGERELAQQLVLDVAKYDRIAEESRIDDLQS
jgi:hypothetical protein